MTLPLVKSATTTDFDDHLDDLRQQVETRLGELLPNELTPPEQLHKAMRYSLLGSGKRIRPLMTVLTTRHLGADAELALDPACAIEMIHTASLIFDDLPMMDDATLRRGRPANHIVFGENTALLAGLALLNRGFGVISESTRLPDQLRVRLVRLVSDAIGSNGVIGGQERELHVDERHRNQRDIESIHRQKTGALFVAAAEVGARIASVPEDAVRCVRAFALNLGLAFQTLDDLIDQQASESAAGKNVRQDHGKATLVACLGAEDARAMAEGFLDVAIGEIRPIGAAAEPLVDFARALVVGNRPIGTPSVLCPDTTASVRRPPAS